jgi:hypothetical protein
VHDDDVLYSRFLIGKNWVRTSILLLLLLLLMLHTIMVVPDATVVAATATSDSMAVSCSIVQNWHSVCAHINMACTLLLQWCLHTGTGDDAGRHSSVVSTTSVTTTVDANSELIQTITVSTGNFGLRRPT